MTHKKFSNPPYIDRDSRNAFIATEFKEYISKSVLNVGGGGMHFLKKYLPKDTEYYEMDIAGTPDIKINLEKELPIPKENNSYETVICTDVLEHLDNAHDVMSELIRISNRYIIVSLPNPLSALLSDMRLSEYKSSGKFYGLPTHKPEDRHKWFFNANEANEFLTSQAQQYDLKIKENFTLGYYGYSLKGKISRFFIELVFGKQMRVNLTTNAVWIVYEKTVK
jgi:hypothetical protein